jgi:hypothetical protein
MWKFGRSKNNESVTEQESVEELISEGSENSLLKRITFVVLLLIFSFYILGIYWSAEPEFFEVNTSDAYLSQGQDKKLIVGYTTLLTTEKVASTLMNKNGGYLSNDILPPSVFLDNIPAWEFGVIVQIRDMASSLRNDMSRSQSQSVEDNDLKKAEPLFNYSHSRWLVPASEGKFEDAIEKLAGFRTSLAASGEPNVQFYARADNLNAWLDRVNKRLGSLSQRLSASVGQERINTDLSGESAANQSTHAPNNVEVKTPWLEIDDNFYEARGACWALIHLLKAVQIDFGPVLEKKNAKASLAQIIRELESTQETVWSPMILNGSGFGGLANHSLVMANYISRANAGLIDLRELLTRG